MKLLVSGGLGFIGLNFVLRNRGHEVTVIDKQTYASNSSTLLPQNVKYIHSDIRSINKLKIDTDFDWIVHFAAESHVDNALFDATPFWESNVQGTYELTLFALKNNIKFFHVSTDEVFGEWKEGEPEFTEESSYKPNNMYAVSKAASDQIVRAQHRSHGLEYIITNCGNNYGKFQHPEKFIPKLLAGKVTLHGKNIVRDWVDVRDHCDAINFLISKDAKGTYVVGSRDAHTLEETSSILGKKVTYNGSRPGVDVGYKLNPSKLESLGWKPNYKLKDYI